MKKREYLLNYIMNRLREELKELSKRMKSSALVSAETSLNEQILVNGKIKVSHLELISVHIPKTAGTSFRNILSDIYGKGLFRIDIDNNGKIAVNQDPNFSAQNLLAMTVAHGHFDMEQFREKFEYDPKVPVIVWLRDPVERIISDYRYKSSILHDYAANEIVPRVLKRMEKSLFEFASLPSSQNIITERYFKGMKLGNFAFVGIVENYEKDIQKLSHIMDWKIKKIYRHNVTSKKLAKASEDELRIIKNLNAKDIEIYKQAKANY
jgi:hypothetical protein